jgi:DegV family protein with EDD domain
MSKIIILTCSETGIPKNLAKDLGIIFLPYYVIYLGKSVNELEMDPVKLYRSMRTKSEMPTTSHPSLEDYRRIFEEAGQDGSELIYIALLSSYSKAYEVATLAQKKLPGLNLTIVDSRSGTSAHALIAMEAAIGGSRGEELERSPFSDCRDHGQDQLPAHN